MKGRFMIAMAALAAALGLSAGLFTIPAGADTSSMTTSVLDSATNQAWDGTEVAGASAIDTATVTGDGTDPLTGSVVYSFFANGTCADDPSQTESVSLPGDGSVPNSPPTGPLSPGSYSFNATYSGAGDNDSGASSCEPFSVGLLAATTSTVVFDAANNAAWNGNEATGAQALDTATVAGSEGTTLTGTVTYSFFTNGSCSGGPASTDPVSLNPDGSVPPSVATAPLGGGNYSFDAVYGGDANYAASPVSGCEQFNVDRAPVSTSTVVLDASNNATWGAGEVTGASALDTAAIVGGVNGFTPTGTVTYSFFTNTACTGGAVTDPVSVAGDGSVPNSTATGALGAGNYSYDTIYSGDDNYSQSSPSTCEHFSVGKASPVTVSTVVDADTSAPWTDMELSDARAQDSATVTGAAGIGPTGQVTYIFFPGNSTCDSSSTSAGTFGIGTHSSTTGPLNAGSYSYLATYDGDANYLPAAGTCEPFTVAKNVAPGQPSITDIPTNGTAIYGGRFTATYVVQSDGAPSATSTTPSVCVVSNSLVSFVGVGQCALIAHTAGTPNFGASDGTAQVFSVLYATPSSPAVANIPTNATEFGSFVASVSTTGDGLTSVASISTGVCVVGADGHSVSFVGFGVCTLTASVAQGAHYYPGTGSTQSFPVGPAARGYWLVGSDGGIFSFGAASFYGSMGSVPLQRPVVGITPSASRTGYWLVASDGGIFSFGTSSYYGSIPGVGLHPAGSGLPNSLNAPIVAMVPSTSGHGYFMVASDGGVFAFGDAHFAGSCPGLGGCDGKAVSVMPDSTGKGYWLVTNVGAVYAFGDAAFYGAPTPTTVPVVNAVATPDWRGYWLLFANGVVDGFGDASSIGAPVGYVNTFNPATSIFPTADGRGYWVAAARGDVFAYGDAPFLGSEAAAGLNGNIIAAFGF